MSGSVLVSPLLITTCTLAYSPSPQQSPAAYDLDTMIVIIIFILMTTMPTVAVRFCVCLYTNVCVPDVCSCVFYQHLCCWLQAVEAYEAAVKGDAGHQAAALALAKLHLDRGDEEAGRGVCTQLLAAQPDNVQAQLLMVQLLSTQVSLSPHLSLPGSHWWNSKLRP